MVMDIFYYLVNTGDGSVVFTCPSEQTCTIPGSWNGIQPSLIWLFILVPFLLWQVKMSSVKANYLLITADSKENTNKADLTNVIKTVKLSSWVKRVIGIWHHHAGVIPYNFFIMKNIFLPGHWSSTRMHEEQKKAEQQWVYTVIIMRLRL